MTQPDSYPTSADREREIVELLYRSQGCPAPEWPQFAQACRRALLSGIRSAAGYPASLSQELVEDLMQDTRLRLYANDYRVLREVQGPMPAALLGLLKTMATSVTVDYFRYRQCQKRAAHREVALDRCGSVPAPDSAPDQALLLRAVERTLPRILPPDRCARYQRIFWLHHRHCFSAREIAALPEVQLSAKGVESALKRMMDGLRATLAPRTLAAGKPAPTGREGVRSEVFSQPVSAVMALAAATP